MLHDEALPPIENWTTTFRIDNPLGPFSFTGICRGIEIDTCELLTLSKDGSIVCIPDQRWQLGQMNKQFAEDFPEEAKFFDDRITIDRRAEESAYHIKKLFE